MFTELIHLGTFVSKGLARLHGALTQKHLVSVVAHAGFLCDHA